jgi:hypothetical protein
VTLLTYSSAWQSTSRVIWRRAVEGREGECTTGL